MGCRSVILGLLMVLLGSTGQAAPVIGVPVTWDGVAPDSLGWASVDGNATIAAVEPGGNPGGYLQIQFGVTAPAAPQIDHVANGGANYTGDYSALAVSFDYLGFNNPFLYLYFQSGVDGSIWSHAFNTPSTGWEHVAISFFDPTAWTPDASSISYEVARTNVTLLGFFVETPDASGPFTYGIDNLTFGSEQIATPEPDAVILLMAVVLCLLVTFRMDRFISRSDWMKRFKLK
ncbi:MAG: hypothetical protein WCS52_02680 [bacterium]